MGEALTDGRDQVDHRPGQVVAKRSEHLEHVGLVVGEHLLKVSSVAGVCAQVVVADEHRNHLKITQN